ncbi:MAG: M48 family metalloprotease [Acidobacteria bacterium]|nr:M48 family metalloprotease [Acidobacteriota bacterium]
MRLPGARVLLACLGALLFPASGVAQQPAATGESGNNAIHNFSRPEDDPSTIAVRKIEPPGNAPLTVAEKIERGMAVDPMLDVNKIGARSVGDGLNVYSMEREQELGRSLAMDFERQANVINDPLISEYINRIGQNIVRNSDARFPFVIKVLDDDEVNAFALPGGYFFVNSGLILAADNEAELAGVMAHEVAHVAARHVTKNYTRAQLFNFASIPLIFVGGPIGLAVREVAGLAVPLSFLKFSRDAEREADMLGLQYSYRAGYDPQAFVQFFERLKTMEKAKHSSLAKAFSTHPMTADRIRQAQEEIAQDLPGRGEYIVTTSDFVEAKTRLMQLEDEHRVEWPHGAKPTLRKRNGKPADSGSQQGNDGPPVLRKRPDASL